MEDEGEGLERFLFELIHDDEWRTGRLPEREFWDRFMRTELKSVLGSLATDFAPYIATKLGASLPDKIDLQIHRLMCLEAGDGFVEHTPHAHMAAANWVFTMLLYIDDAGRTDRGTSLYSIAGLTPDEIGTIRGARYGSGRIERAVDVPFKPGTAFAFFDTPISVHGSTPFKVQGTGRKSSAPMLASRPTMLRKSTACR